MTRRRSWFYRSLAFVLLLVVASECFSLSLRTQSAHRYLTSRLEAAFGRPVEVGHFAFSLLDGPRIEAEPITLGEDRRFGQEYFVRAERLTAGLRWGRLFLGHFEFGTLSFTRPSLNLVRAADGAWNIESWMPSPATVPVQRSVSSLEGAPAHLYKVEVDGGRINFSRGADRLPFALVEVRGSLEQESPGRWRLDLAAQPVRAGAVVQQAGTLHVQGRIAGTSARLQPAELYLTWEDASLADVLRLARGRDFAVRGRLALELTARSHSADGSGWSFSLSARGSQIHRWDLTESPANPAVNFKAEAHWTPGEARMDISSVLLQAPHSQIHGAGVVAWPLGIKPDIGFDLAAVDLDDLLAWYRAFRPGVAEGVAVNGTVHGSFAITNLPMGVNRAELSSSGATLVVPGLAGPVHLGEFDVASRRDLIQLEKVLIQMPRDAKQGEAALAPALQSSKTKKNKTAKPILVNQLVLGASVTLLKGPARVVLDGAASHVEDLLTLAAALGRPSNPQWRLEGPAEVHLRWELGFRPWTARMAGSVDLRGSRLLLAGLNLPVEISAAHMVWGEKDRRVTLAGTKALGAEWQGTLAQRITSPGDAPAVWEFKLSADHLSASELDRWLGPRARPGLFERLFPPAAGAAWPLQKEITGESVLNRLHASGQLTVEKLVVDPVQIDNVKTNVVLQDRTVRLSEVQADFQAGKLSGAFEARLGSHVEYRADANFDNVNLAMLSAATKKLKDRIGGIASGEIHLKANGVGREVLVDSFTGHGAFTVRDPMYRGLDLNATLAQGAFRPGISQWVSAAAAFSFGSGQIEFQKLRLEDGLKSLQASGTIQFSHTWNLQVHSIGAAKEKQPAVTNARAVRLTGTLEAPQVAPILTKPAAH